MLIGIPLFFWILYLVAMWVRGTLRSFVSLVSGLLASFLLQ